MTFVDIVDEDEVRKIVEDFIADGNLSFPTMEEHEALSDRIEVLEKKLSDLDFWKADRNHYHQESKLA